MITALKKQRTFKSIHIVLLVLVLAIPRILYLDQDMPSYMISGLSQEDEPYYCIGGVTRFLESENRINAEYAKMDIEALQILNTPTTYLSLKLFGNNYYGLRIPVAIVSIIITLLLSLFANRQGSSRISVLAIVLFLSFEFYTFLMGRYYNPQIFCIVCITIILTLVFSENPNSKLNLFLVGLTCVLMVLGVYVYTIFIAGAVFIWYLVEATRERKMRRFYPVLLGGVAGIALWGLYFVVFGIDFKELMSNLLAHGGGVEAESVSAGNGPVKKFILSFTQIVSTNFFRYNYFLLGAFVLLLVYSVSSIRRNRSSSLFLLIVMLFVLQNYFVQSYPFKKHVIFYPVLIMFFILNLKNIFYWLAGLEFWKRAVMFIISSACIYYCDKLNNSEVYWAGFNYGYYENVPSVLRWFNLAVCAVVLFFVFVGKLVNVASNKFAYLALLCFLPSLLFIADQFFSKRTFYTRDALTNMRSEIRGKYMLQEFSHAFQFYSDCIPLMSNYDRVAISKTDIKELYRKTRAYAIVKSFANDKMRKLLNEAEVTYNDLTFVVVKKYPLRFYNYYLLKFKE